MGENIEHDMKTWGKGEREGRDVPQQQPGVPVLFPLSFCDCSCMI